MPPKLLLVVGAVSVVCAVLFLSKEVSSISDAHHINLRNQKIRLSTAPEAHTEIPDIAKWMIESIQDEENLHQYLVAVDGPLSTADRHTIEAALQAPLGQYVDKNAYIVLASPEAAAAARSAPRVVWVGVLRPQYKVAPEALSSDVKALKVMMASGSPDTASQRVCDQLAEARLPAECSQVSSKSMVVDLMTTGVPSSLVVATWLSERPLVHWIEPAPEFKPFSSRAPL